jgi:hypothetical protein
MMMSYQRLMSELNDRKLWTAYAQLPQDVRSTIMVALDQTDDRLREHLTYVKRTARPELAALCQQAAQLILDARAEREGR